MTWEKKETKIEGCFIFKNPHFSDDRGSFAETYKESLFHQLGLPIMRQDNHLVTKRGGIRAMHWQHGEHAQAKLINVINGSIFDAVYDLRPTSSTFKKMDCFDLDADSGLLFVPAGCAHGFQGVSEVSVVQYKTDNEYNFESQRAFVWNDENANIPWPVREALVSPKDAIAPSLSEVLLNG